MNALTHVSPTASEAQFRVMMELASEIWVLRDRLAVLEHSLQQQGSLNPSALDQAINDPALKARLQSERDLFLSRVLQTAAGMEPQGALS